MSHNCELYTLNILLAAAFPEMLIISMELQNKKCLIVRNWNYMVLAILRVWKINFERTLGSSSYDNHLITW